MPTTVTSSSGRTYHLFQLAEASYWEPEESIRFTELENDLGDGYSSQVLYGANTGLRSWKLKLPTLAHTDVLPNTVTDVSGATVSREEYLWNLFCYTKVAGQPFVFTSPRNGQYYLVRFADKELSYAKMRVKLYSTGVELKQVRVAGESVFQLPNAMATANLAFWYNETEHSSPNWGDAKSASVAAATGDVIFDAGTQNGLNVIRFNSVDVDGVMQFPAALFGNAGWDLFLVMKVRESAFSDTSAIVSQSGDHSPNSDLPLYLLQGTSGTTKFADIGLTTLEYRMNGVSYAAANRQAPMNTFGIVHLRSTLVTGAPIDGWLQLGQFFSSYGSYPGKFDIGEIFLTNTLLTETKINSITEYLTVKWGIV